MKKSARLNFFIKLTILVVICFCAVNIFRLRTEYNSLKATEAELLKQKEEYLDEIERMKAEYEHPMDDKYIERKARDLGLYYPDEIIFYNDR